MKNFTLILFVSILITYIYAVPADVADTAKSAVANATTAAKGVAEGAGKEAEKEAEKVKGVFTIGTDLVKKVVKGTEDMFNSFLSSSEKAGNAILQIDTA